MAADPTRAALEGWPRGPREVLFPSGTSWMLVFHTTPIDASWLITDNHEGERVPLPHDEREVLGIGQALQAVHFEKEMFDPVQAQRMYRESVSAFEEGKRTADLEDPMIVHQLKHSAGFLAYEEKFVAKLKAERLCR